MQPVWLLLLLLLHAYIDRSLVTSFLIADLQRKIAKKINNILQSFYADLD